MIISTMARPVYTHVRKPINFTLCGNPQKPWETIGGALDIDGFVCNRKMNFIHTKHHFPTSGQICTVLTQTSFWFRPTPDFAAARNISTERRELTVPEHAALQGFPPGYEFVGGRCSQKRQIGNALPPPVTREFFCQNGVGNDLYTPPRNPISELDRTKRRNTQPLNLRLVTQKSSGVGSVSL